MPTLDWLNRAAAFDIAKNVPYRLLEAVSEHRANATASEVKAPLHVGKDAENDASRHDLFSALEPALNKADSEKTLTSPEPATTLATEDNLLIQGDNLEALKALLPFYRGQVKCIFIDPPYNTKSAFEHYDDNLEHAQWLSMMLPRLQLLRELLREDGSIWVTIDDNEGHYLKVMMDEVFGRGNFVANVIWEKVFATKNSSQYLSVDHDHIFVYGRRSEGWVPNLMPRTAKQDSIYKNPDNDSRGIWTSDNLTARNSYSLGIYPVTNPAGRVIAGPPPGTFWRVSKAKLEELDTDNRIWWGKDGSGVPRLKRFLHEVQQGIVPRTLWPYDEVGHTQEAKKEAVALFEMDVFGTPKPERLIQRIIHIATNPNDLILDSFLGSGTTAAVAQKMGRRWIGIEMGEHAKTHCLPRLQKVLDGEQGGISKAVNWQGGGSFRFMQLGAPVFDETGAIHAEVRFATLAAFVWMQETRTPWARSVRPERSEGFDKATAPVRETLRQAQGEQVMQSPYLGAHDGVAYYLLFNGILGDRRPQGGNVLTRAVLDWLTLNFPHLGPRVIFGESVRVGHDRLSLNNVVFRSIPHEVEAR